MKNYRFIKPILGTSRCNCEASGCHPNGNCQEKARYLVEIFGIKQSLCLECHAKAREWLAKYRNLSSTKL